MRRRLSPGVPLALEYAHVRHAKRGVAQRVAHRVDGAVDVAQIVEEVPYAGHPFLAGVVGRLGIASTNAAVTAATTRGRGRERL